MIDLVARLFSSLKFYIDKIWSFSILASPYQIFLTLNPALLRFLSKDGLMLFAAIFALSFIHTRLFQILIILPILMAKLPDEHDKSFWRTMFIFSIVLFLWFNGQFFSELKWIPLWQSWGV
jgi:hypothetical protein